MIISSYSVTISRLLVISYIFMKNSLNPFNGKRVNLKGRKLNTIEKEFLGGLVASGKYRIEKVSQFYNCPYSNVGRYAFKVKKDVQMKNGGRPSKLDAQSTLVIIEALGGEKRIQMNSEDYDELLLKEFSKTQERSPGSGSNKVKAGAKVKPLNRRDVKRFEAKNKILTDNNPEETTDAREKGCSSIRNCFATACAYGDQSAHVLPVLTCNYDATQSTVGDVGQKKVTGKRIGAIKGGKSKKVKKTSFKKGLVNYFLKSVPIMCADGIFGDMVHIHGDALMPKGTIDVHECQGIGVSMRYDEKAYIIFCHDRSLNEAYEIWYQDTIVMPFVESLRKMMDLPASLHVAAVNADGEDRQIMVLADETRQRRLVAANIIVDKPSSGTTEVVQSADQDPFITKNNHLKSITDADVDTASKRFKNVTAVFAAHQTRMASLYGNKNYSGMSSAHVRMGCYGQLRVSMAFSKALSPSCATNSFAKVGHVPFNPNKMIDNLFVHIKTDDRAAFLSALPDGIAYYHAHGEVPNAKMDEWGVPNNDEEIELANKENVTMCQRSSTRLTHETQWKILIAQRDSRASARIKKADKAQGEPKIYKPYKPKAPKKKAVQK